MAGSLGDIVASLGIDRSRWDADTRKVDQDLRRLKVSFASLGAQSREQEGRRFGDQMASGSHSQRAIDRARRFQQYDQNALDQALDDHIAGMEAAEAAQHSMSNSSSRATTAILELGRGIEDAAIGYQMQGVSGAFRAAANNVGVLLSTLGPWPMVFGAVGIATISLASSTELFNTKIADADELLEHYNNRIARHIELLERRQRIRQIDSMAGIESETASLERDIERLQEDIARREAELERARRTSLAESARNIGFFESVELWFRGDDANRAKPQLDTENTLLQDQIAATTDLRNLQQEILEIRMRSSDVAQAELDAERQAIAQAEDRSLLADALAATESIRQEAMSEEQKRMQRREQQRTAIQAAELWDADQTLAILDQLEARERAQSDLAAFREEHGNILGSRFGDAGFATTLESGSQEAFRAVAQHRQRDPQDEVLGVSRDQLKALHRIERQLEYRAEAEIDVGELDL